MRMKRRVLQLVSGVLVVLLVLALAGALALYAMGLRVSGLSWQQGLLVSQWRWQPQDCVQWQGENLRLDGLWPLRVRLSTLQGRACPDEQASDATTAQGFPDGLPWTPPFDVTVHQLDLPVVSEWPLPTLALSVRQRHQQWQLGVCSLQSCIQASYGQQDGLWRASGDGQLGEWLAQVRGRWQWQGSGTWQGTPRGQLSVMLSDVGRVEDEASANVSLDGDFVGEGWRLRAALSEPLPLMPGWWLEGGHPSVLQGEGATLTAMDADLRMTTPHGEARLQARSDARQAATGQGALTLSGPALDGRLAFVWQDRMLTLPPTTLTLPDGILVTLPAALSIPMALNGEAVLPLQVSYQGLQLQTKASQLRWQGADWLWAGALALQGRWHGYQVTGQWEGEATPRRLAGKPLRLTIAQGEDQLNVSLPVEGMPLVPEQGTATAKGQWHGYPVQAALQFARGETGWQGSLSGQSRVVALDHGGKLEARVPWRWQGGALHVQPGAQLRIDQGLVGQTLLRPVTVSTRQGLVIDEQGMRGALQVQADGLAAARWQLPRVKGEATLKGDQGQAHFTIDDWKTALSMDGTLEGGGARGSLQLNGALVPAMGQGLGMTPTAGQFQGDGRWQWQQGVSVEGELALADGEVAWGSVEGRGLDGLLAVGYEDGAPWLASRGPVTVQTLDVGTPITNLTFALEGNLSRWHFRDVRADVLGGSLVAPALDWPSDQVQPVVISQIDLQQVAALQASLAVSLAGRIGGYVPLQLGEDFLVVEQGRLANEGPLMLRVPPSQSVQAMAQSNQAVQLALDSISHLQIPDFQARMTMDREGWLDAQMTLKGVNPERKNLPVVFNYTHRENLLALLRSLRIGEEITQQLRTEKQ